MSDERDFGQRVMAAAGVAPFKRWYVGNPVDGESCYTASNEAEYLRWKAEYREYCEHRAYGVHAWDIYPDPLTPEGFVALWYALEARGWRVEFRTLCDGTLSQVYKADEMGRPDLASIFQGGHESRAAALLEAAAQALGVKP